MKMTEDPGTGRSRERITVEEALSTPDASILFPKVISTIMLEAAEPVYLASRFLQKITLTEGRSMEFPVFGAIRAFEVAEGQELMASSLA